MPLDSLCIELPALVKAREVGGRRIVEVEASNEAIDSEGDKILQSALLNSAKSFVKSGHLDIDHLSEIGDRLGLADPGEFIVGKPLEVKDLGDGRTGVVGELFNDRRQADSLWASLTAEPPVLWRASIYGFPLPNQVIDCRVSKAEDANGATRFLVKGLHWKSLAFTKHPINDAITGNARVITAKSFIELAKARIHQPNTSIIKPLDYILSPCNPEELAGHYFYHIKAGKCPHVACKSKAFQAHFEYCCGDTAGEASVKSLALVELLNSVEKSERVKIMDKKATFIESITGLFKTAVEKSLDGKLEGIKDVGDLWQPERNEHENPSKREVNTGPAERASGGGASPMVNRYSDFAPQSGLTRQYEALDGLMADMQKALRRLDVHQKAIETVASAIADLQKAEEPKGPDETTFIGKAQSKLAKARVALRKADLADEEDKEEREERKSHLAAAADLLKAAKRLLSKASEDSKAEEEDEIEKAIATVRTLNDKVAKAQAAIVKAEDEEKKEEEEAKKSACASCPTCSPAVTKKAEDEEKKEEDEAKKAVTIEAKKAEDTEEEEKKDDTAKAISPVLADRVEKALAGFEIMQSDMMGLFNAISGMSRTPTNTPPTFMKAAPTADISTRLDEAIDSGELEPGDAMYAQTLYQRLKAADAGKIKHADVLAQISTSKEAIRNIFQAAA